MAAALPRKCAAGIALPASPCGVAGSRGCGCRRSSFTDSHGRQMRGCWKGEVVNAWKREFKANCPIARTGNPHSPMHDAADQFGSLIGQIEWRLPRIAGKSRESTLRRLDLRVSLAHNLLHDETRARKENIFNLMMDLL